MAPYSPSNFQVKDTLYKFWVLKVRLRDWGFNGEGDGGANNTLALTHDRSFNQTNMSRIGSQHCRMTESVNGRNRGKNFVRFFSTRHRMLRGL